MSIETCRRGKKGYERLRRSPICEDTASQHGPDRDHLYSRNAFRAQVRSYQDNKVNLAHCILSLELSNSLVGARSRPANTL